MWESRTSANECLQDGYQSDDHYCYHYGSGAFDFRSYLREVPLAKDAEAFVYLVMFMFIIALLIQDAAASSAFYATTYGES